jgi:hypothetical protein
MRRLETSVHQYYRSVADPDPVCFYPLDPGWIFSGSRIQLLFLVKFPYIIFTVEYLMLSHWTWTTGTLKTYPWNRKQQEKGQFSFAATLFTYDVGSEIREEKFFVSLSGIRDKTSRIRNTATVVLMNLCLKAMVPQSELDLELVKSILSEYRIHNADITLR